MWRKVVSNVKKGKEKEVGDYRGLTSMSARYKVYMMMLVERMKEEVETKRVVSQNQEGFREEMDDRQRIRVELSSK